MGEKEDREKAEKLAAAKKRVAQLQKKKKAAAAGGGEKSGTKSRTSKDESPKSPVKETAEAEDIEKEDVDAEEKAPVPVQDTQPPQEDEEPDADEATFNEAVKSANQNEDDDEEPDDQISDTLARPKARHSGRQPSVSLQSKLRSTSFRDTAPGPASPSVGSLSRIEELEQENKKLAEEASEYESRWRKTEEELEELREDNASNSTSEISKLKAEIELLKRQQRQNPASGAAGAAKGSRRESIISSSHSPDESGSLRKEIESKDSTIADMQLEISRLRSQLSSQTSSCDEHGSQILSLTTSLSTAETKVRSLETELTDTKKFLIRASEKAVLDGTERTSKDTKIRNLERDLEAADAQRDEVAKKAEQLEKKIEAMNKLHRETEARSASKLSAAEHASREIPVLRAKVSTLEAENARLREKHRRAMSGSGADEGLDELEDEERNKLSRRIRELEGQVFELQRGVWRDKRTALQPSIDSGGAAERKSLEAGEDFDEVDLSGGASSHASRRASGNLLQRTMSPGAQKHSNFSQYISSGLNAFLPSTTSPPPGGRPRNDSLLQDFDDDAGFDETAFAQAQREEEAKKMLEHVREVKRALKNWKGWRLDLVDARRGEGGWEIFEV